MATVAQTDSNQNTTSSTTHTYAAQTIGANGGDDVIYLTFGFRTVSSAAITGTTIDGEAITPVVEHFVDDGGGVRSTVAIYSFSRAALPDPDQTDVDVVFTFSANALRSSLDTWVSPDASVTAFDTAQAAGTGALDLSADTADGSIGLGVVYAGDTATPGYTWVGLTETTDASRPGPNWFTTAEGDNLSAATPLTITATPGTTVSQVGVSAIFEEFTAPGTIEHADTDTWVVGGTDTASFTLTLPSVFGVDESIYVLLGARSSAGVLVSESIEIDSEPVPKVREVTVDEGNNISSVIGIYAIKRADLPTPTATSITLTGQYNVNLLRAAVSVYVGQATKITGNDNAFSTTADLSTLSVDLDLDIPVGGIALGGAYFSGTGGAATADWTGLTERADVSLTGPDTWTSASVESLSGAEPLAVTVDFGADGTVAGLAVSFDLEAGLGDPAAPDLLRFMGERTSVTGGTAATMELPLGPMVGVNETVYVAFGTRSISGFPAISSITFDGIEPELIMLPVRSGEGEAFVASTTCFAYGFRRLDLPVPSAEFVTMEVTYTVSTLRSAACVWVGQSLDVEPLSVGSDTGEGTPEELSVTINIPLLGGIVAFYYSGDPMTGGSFDWTNIVEDTNIELVGSNSFSGATELIGAEGAQRTISALAPVAPNGALIAFSVLERVPEVIFPPGSPAIPFQLFINQGGPTQTPEVGDSWTAGNPYVIPDDIEREPIQPGINSPRIKGIGWRRAMMRLRQARGLR